MGVWLALGTLMLAETLPPPPADSTVAVPGGVIAVTIGPLEPSLPERRLLAWVESCGRAVAAYFGEFPVARVDLDLKTSGRGGVGGGRAWCYGRARIELRVGRDTDEGVLSRDWVLTHEMVHLAFPDMAEAYGWIEEGLATYVEPVARARAGLIPEAQVWEEMTDGLPKGRPGARDVGLDGTREWGRLYWGGALFWLLADVEIREQTGNRMGLEHALRGILAARGRSCDSWDITRALDAGDRALGRRVLRGLHDRLGRKAYVVDLDALWARLGVVRRGRTLTFDERAPLAAVRRAITQPAR